jgi:hypothetical protein
VRNSDANTNGIAKPNTYCYCYSYSWRSYTDSDGDRNSDGHANRHLPGNLYDNYYHWHDNRRRHRYRQPLRRL